MKNREVSTSRRNYGEATVTETRGEPVITNIEIKQGTTSRSSNYGEARVSHHEGEKRVSVTGSTRVIKTVDPRINDSSVYYEKTTYVGQPNSRTETHYEGDVKVTTTTTQSGWQDVKRVDNSNNAYTQVYQESVRRY